VPAGYLKQLAWLQTFLLNFQIIPLLLHSAVVAVAEVDRINLRRLEVRYYSFRLRLGSEGLRLRMKMYWQEGWLLVLDL
jgi:hypothetical protein